MDLHVCSQDVKAMALLDGENAFWEQWTSKEQYNEFAPRPMIDPIAQMIGSTARTTRFKAIIQEPVRAGW